MRKSINVGKNDESMPEKVFVAVLSILLFIGSAAVYVRESRPLAAITVERGELKEQFSLAEVEERLKAARRVCINEATAEEMTAIPGIGPAISERIFEYREKNGRFMTVESLCEVKGIGPAKLEKMREYVSLE
jgi:comEA protein